LDPRRQRRFGVSFLLRRGFPRGRRGRATWPIPTCDPSFKKSQESHKASCHAYWRRCSWRKSKASHHGITGSVFGSAFGCGPSAVIADPDPIREAAAIGKQGCCALKGRGSWLVAATICELGACSRWRSRCGEDVCNSAPKNEGAWTSWSVKGAEPPTLGALELAALEEERAHATAPEGDLARAVLAQSQALTALLWQMAQSSEDPMMDLGATASSATRGALGRAKLQAELASHSGSFFMSVLRALARRMQPATSTTGSAEDLLRRGVSGTMYMERFGGFGRHRDLGLILFQVMAVMDLMQAENHGAAKDALALLAVCIDQAV